MQSNQQQKCLLSNFQQTAWWWCDQQKVDVPTVGCCGMLFIIPFSQEIKINTFSLGWVFCLVWGLLAWGFLAHLV